MSRKHFKAIAAILHMEMMNSADPASIERIALGLAQEFAMVNPNFDRQKFLATSGVHVIGSWQRTVEADDAKALAGWIDERDGITKVPPM